MIGYYGYPDPELINTYANRYPGEVVDLDVDYGREDSGILPKVYCQIIKNIINNALFYGKKLDAVIASVGEAKCDGGRFACAILKDLGFEVIKSAYTGAGNNRHIALCAADMPLREKVLKIMGLVRAETFYSVRRSRPVMGFWGVPPSDLSILDLFPSRTHVYGWIRCVEAARPADLELEMYVEDVPTVFFAQSFCQKSSLAKYLADKNKGLYVDADRAASESVKAKIEAFVKLRAETAEKIQI